MQFNNGKIVSKVTDSKKEIRGKIVQEETRLQSQFQKCL